MAKVFIEESTLTSIGDAIREKTGKTALIDPINMGIEIGSIEAGGGSVDIPEEAFIFTGNCNYRFSGGGWDWFVELYGDKITTKDIKSLTSAFENADLKEIPFVLNVKDLATAASCFSAADQLEVCPKIRGTFVISTATAINNIVINCYRLRDLEDLFEPEAFDSFKDIKITSQYSVPKLPSFQQCYSLRRVPSWWYKFRLNPESTVVPATTYYVNSGTFTKCYSLDEVLDIPVWVFAGALTSNTFNSTFPNTYRIKRITFETNSGQPIVANWKAQTIDLSSNVGYASGKSYILNYNSGITADKEVTDDATYQALKNDPDWFTCKIEYSRYNHDSAVETINSLPDTSAYLASAGGTNTIKFKKAAGSRTDGGAIENLTAEEIAVAAAKGWTVTLS